MRADHEEFVLNLPELVAQILVARHRRQPDRRVQLINRAIAFQPRIVLADTLTAEQAC